MSEPTPTLATRFRAHAEHLDGLYRLLLLGMAEDWEAGGVVREICGDSAPARAVVQLRLLAGVHRLVLTRRAPELALYYPNVGGTADPAGAWPVFEAVLRAHVGELQAALDVAPQTNEPGRAVALLIGLFDAVARSGRHRVRLLEPGASAGLNLLVDRYRIGGDGPPAWAYGPAASALQLPAAVSGSVQPVEFEIVDRRGCDLAPVDPTTTEGRLRLTSFVWPHQLDRHERLRAALRMVGDRPATVDKAAAAEWLAGQLAAPVPADVLTVVWYSVTRQYWSAADADGVDGAIARAGDRSAVATVSMEHTDHPPGRPAELVVTVREPGGHPPVLRRLGTVADHGVPVTLAPPVTA